MEGTDFSYANLANAAFLEELYQRFLKDPKSVDSTWRYFFSGMEFSSTSEEGGSLGVFRLIQAYRIHGHKKASSSPLQVKKQTVEALELSNLGLKIEDLERLFSTFGLLPEKEATLSLIIAHLEKIYCGAVGYEFMGLGSGTEKWMLSKIEGKKELLSKEEKEKILNDLDRAELFESFIHTKYPGQTRFSLEGGETFIPFLKVLIEEGAKIKAEEVFIGMAHRGRLNVLVHVLDKPYTQIFQEFEDTAEEEGSGDVKYHKGAHANIKTSSGQFVEVALAPNPSHLESVDPVVEGQTRAKQDLKKDTEKRETVIPILVHGDASLAGQGVVYEILQMRGLKGYTTGGTIHIVLNNNIGYTTLPEEGRSTPYCTDIAKTFGAPVFHVNAEDPESCILAAKLAMQFRQEFHLDVFIDINCYRKYGHNEGDEPTFTQPLEYKKIKEKKSIKELFKQKLLDEGVLSEELMKQKEDAIRDQLQEALTSALAQTKKSKTQNKKQSLKEKAPTVAEKTLKELAEKFCFVPKEFHIHPKLQKLMQERLKMEKIDWGMGEHLAYASLLFEQVHVRLSGQDVERGTFSHRHCVWVDQETSEKYSSLNYLSKTQAPFAVYNSLLSEFAVMGFDLGYSLSYPKSLVLWEAQFGDFVNGSQVIIDQYLATSEQKWARRSNLTLLLPHGNEGKGPEHSSAKIERFLQLCAEDNLIVANCTTPAQFFHLLRRQAYLSDKRPLIVFTPKLLLRHPACTSLLSDFASDQGFLEVLSDNKAPPEKPTRIIFCSGKVFYDLVQEREKRKDVISLIIRIEQLYPFPKEEILKVLETYPSIQKVLWVQEEQKNMGAWSYIQIKFLELLGKTIKYVGREESASPAAGSYTLHKEQYEAFMQEAFEEK